MYCILLMHWTGPELRFKSNKRFCPVVPGGSMGWLIGKNQSPVYMVETPLFNGHAFYETAPSCTVYSVHAI